VFLLGLLLSGCVSPRDIRVLQSQLDEMQAEQRQVSATVAHLDSLTADGSGSARDLVVDLKHSVSDMDARMTQMEARLADLESRWATQNLGANPEPLVPGAVAKAETDGDSPSAQGLYQEAFAALKREDHKAAISGFRAYLKEAPGGTEAASAVFWIGESFQALGQSDSALVQYQFVVDHYPQSAKVPAALLKSGDIYESRGDKAKAYPYYRRLKEEFPQSLEYQQLRRQLEE
jgi:tol-pal system protein YbgF